MSDILIEKIVENIEKVIIGKNKEVNQVIKGILAEGHILMEDVPGVGKTMMVKALAKTLNLSYSRIQFTPDLLPSDITGVSIYNQKTGEFQFKKGPIFANLVLADEINRTSPKTQSALLEVMEENQVSEGNNTYLFNRPFVVLATQNPIEYQGTFLLPEAQLDRFMIKIKIGYADKQSESNILQLYKDRQPIEEIASVADAEDIIRLQNATRKIHVAKGITDYISNITYATRNSEYLTLGASTRAALALLKIGQAEAFIEGRDYVIPEDIKNNAVNALSHRLCLSSYARAENLKNDDVVLGIIEKTTIPRISKND